MERAIQVQLVKFLEANEVLSAYQSGFRKGHSTETAVTYLTDQILEHMDNQQMTGSVFIDLKKAFDLVDHSCLLQKLEHYVTMFYLDNGVMTTPKRRILSFVFDVLS